MFTIRIRQLGLIAFLVCCGSPVQASATVRAPGDSLTYTGRVVEHGTGKPIKGATRHRHAVHLARPGHRRQTHP